MSVWMLIALACNNTKDKKADATTDTTTTQEITADDNTSSVDRSIVYVNSDSVLFNYELYKKSKKELEAKEKQFSNDLKQRASAFQNEVEQYKRSVNTMTIQTAKDTEQRLAAKEKQIAQYNQSLQKQYLDDEKKALDKITENLDDFMTRYAKKNNYKMILGYKQGVTIWYADERLDVTNQVIKALNSEYKNGEKSTEGEAEEE